MIPDNDKLFVWMLVKNLDLPRFKVVDLLDSLGVYIHDRDTDQYIRRSDFVNVLYVAAGR